MPLRLSVRQVRILSVARTAIVLAGIIAAALIASAFAVWWFAERAGLVASLEEAVASGLGLESWTMPAGALLVLCVALTVALAGFAVLVAVLLAIAFNGLGRTVGGIDVVARVERPPSDR